ncbi:helix-turn-helix domain-containing protein [Mycoplasma anserisalpingitidis]|nr:helix-turn-helix domain-containing protein [Mycoplasma anserisalpingitidis]
MNYGFKTLKEIAEMLKRSVSTISREVKRNSNIYGEYDAAYANKKTKIRKCIQGIIILLQTKNLMISLQHTMKKIIVELKLLLNFIKKKQVKKLFY